MQNSIKIPSDMSNIYRVERFVDKIAESLHISDELYGKVSVCVVEAVSNAIQHGNDYEVTKIVFLNCVCESDVLKFIIEDEGDGFDLNAVPDPTLPDNIENIKGRGVFLINNLSDKVVFENKGSKLTIHFNIV